MGGRSQPPVPGHRHAGVGLMNQMDPPMRHGRDDLFTAIGRTIVDHDDFQRWVGLAKHRQQAALDMSGLVVQGNDH